MNDVIREKINAKNNNLEFILNAFCWFYYDYMYVGAELTFFPPDLF